MTTKNFNIIRNKKILADLLRADNKQTIAIFIALLFHVSGCIGMFTSHKQWFINNTPLNLLLMFALLIWTQSKKNYHFFLFMLIAILTGLITEIIGVNTSFLFGNYAYGKVLGPGVKNVPWLIGINWFVTVYCSGVIVTKMHDLLERQYEAAGALMSPKIRFWSLLFDGALLATFFDLVMEPAAVKLGFWRWLPDGNIPFKNYLCWFIISALLLVLFNRLKFNRHNQFAVHLFIIQLLFFGVLRTFL